jgi:hypothetical protein
MARADREIGGLARKPRVLRIDLDEGLEFRLLGLDPREVRLDEIDR